MHRTLCTRGHALRLAVLTGALAFAASGALAFAASPAVGAKRASKTVRWEILISGKQRTDWKLHQSYPGVTYGDEETPCPDYEATGTVTVTFGSRDAKDELVARGTGDGTPDIRLLPGGVTDIQREVQAAAELPPHPCVNPEGQSNVDCGDRSWLAFAKLRYAGKGRLQLKDEAPVAPPIFATCPFFGSEQAPGRLLDSSALLDEMTLINEPLCKSGVKSVGGVPCAPDPCGGARAATVWPMIAVPCKGMSGRTAWPLIAVPSRCSGGAFSASAGAGGTSWPLVAVPRRAGPERGDQIIPARKLDLPITRDLKVVVRCKKRKPVAEGISVRGASCQDLDIVPPDDGSGLRSRAQSATQITWTIGLRRMLEPEEQRTGAPARAKVRADRGRAASAGRTSWPLISVSRQPELTELSTYTCPGS